MPIATLKELIEAGVHYGCRSARWNPKMKPYIHFKQNRIHIIDLRESLKGLIRACHFLSQIAAKGQKVLFVGTKRPAQDIVRQEAVRSENFFVATRWLGGTLTNMNTMRMRIERLEELENLQRSGELQEFSKKMIASLTRECKKIGRNFEGIREMKKVPGALVVVDPRTEHIAVAEAVKLEIPIVAIVDTDSDPDPVDFIIPGNDDAIRSIQCLVSKLAEATLAGTKKAATQAVLAGTTREKTTAQETAKAVEPPPIKDLPQDFTKVSSFSYGGKDGEPTTPE